VFVPTAMRATDIGRQKLPDMRRIGRAPQHEPFASVKLFVERVRRPLACSRPAFAPMYRQRCHVDPSTKRKGHRPASLEGACLPQEPSRGRLPRRQPPDLHTPNASNHGLEEDLDLACAAELRHESACPELDVTSRFILMEELEFTRRRAWLRLLFQRFNEANVALPWPGECRVVMGFARPAQPSDAQPVPPKASEVRSGTSNGCGSVWC
jgi:hypothetical protein